MSTAPHMTTPLIAVDDLGGPAWRDALAAALPDYEVCGSSEVADPGRVEYVVMWDLPAEQLHSFEHLTAVLMMGAGYDHVDLDAMPAVPFVRLVDPAMADDIASYVLSWVIHFQRNFDRFTQAQSTATWTHEPSKTFPRDVTVGVLGAGAIGSVVERTCAEHGFATIGWSRSRHDRPLLQFFADSDVVVDLVPLSASTRHLIGTAELDALGTGVLINVGRGATVDTDALIVALDGALRAAVLDVFDVEPLPATSALWNRADVTVTPHVAGRSDPHTAVPIIAENIAELARGGQPGATIIRAEMT